MKKIVVQVDYENNAEEFWEALQKHDGLANLPIAGQATECVVNEEQLRIIQSLPGWFDSNAPDYAPHPLLICYVEGEDD